VLQDDVPDEVTGLFSRLVAHLVECNASAAPIPGVTRTGGGWPRGISSANRR
jgi:hypothetical protein